MVDKNLNIRVRAKGAKKAKRELKGVEVGLAGLGKAAAVASAAFFGAKMLIAGMQKSIELSSKFNAVSKGFDNLAKSSGFSANTLDKLTKATDGTMNSIDLMTEANNAMLLGIVDSEDQMAQMFDTAQRLAEALGQDTAFGIQSIVTGLGRQSKLMLDNLGIMVDVEKANSDYAASLNISTSALTDNQKKQAFVNAAMASANELVSKLGSETTTAKKEMAALNATMDAVRITIGKDFEPALINAARAMNDFIKSIGDESSGTNKAFGFFAKMLERINPGLAKNIELTNEQTEAQRKQREEAEKIGVGEDLLTAEQALQLGIIHKDLEAETLKIRRDSGIILDAQEVTFKEINSAAESMKELTAQTANSLMTSALMGDNVSESLKRAVIQLGLMVVQAKIYKAIMDSNMFSAGGFFGGAVKFLFGASPTQASPSPNMGNVTINQNFGGMGVIDSNFAANSIIPAINKAVSTGQARITK